LSAAAAIGGGATGASLAAAGLFSGRPLSGEPGGSAGAAAAAGAALGAGAAAGGLAGCCAAATSVKALIKAPATNTRRADQVIMLSSSPVWKSLSRGGETNAGAGGFLNRSLGYFLASAQPEIALPRWPSAQREQGSCTHLAPGLHVRDLDAPSLVCAGTDKQHSEMKPDLRLSCSIG
jgi:hypothetical protein